MVVGECVPSSASPASRPSDQSAGDPLQLYDDNGNGLITCAEARRHGIAPVPRSHPAYRYIRGQMAPAWFASRDRA